MPACEPACPCAHHSLVLGTPRLPPRLQDSVGMGCRNGGAGGLMVSEPCFGGGLEQMTSRGSLLIII